MTATRLDRQIAFTLELDRLKQVERRTWLLDRTRRENDAEHSWHLAMLALVLADQAGPEVAIDRVVRMLLIHDLVEIDAGDSFLFDDEAAADQEARERRAADRIFGLLPPDQGLALRALWDEFEARATPDARFAKALDRFQPLLHDHLTDGGSWRDHAVTAAQVADRLSVIGDGAPRLWDHARRLIAASVANGDLAAGDWQRPALPAAASRLERQLDFIVELDRLKQVFRRTWLINRSRRENDAEHSWQMAVMALVLDEHAVPGVTLPRAIAMLLIHDIVEIDAGDTFFYDTAASLGQEAREQGAADRIFGLLPPDQGRAFRALWDEFEARQSPDARFARALDRLQPLLHNYHTAGGTWAEAGIAAAEVLRRKRVIGDGAPALWTYAQGLVADGVARGYLRA